MNKLMRYLSFRGRANRARFWLTGIAIYVIIFVVSLLMVGLTAVVPLAGLLALPLFVAALIAGLANSVRRLHDRGKSAWWLLLFMGLPMLFLLPASLAKASPDAGAAGFGALCALISLPFSIWAFVEMGCLRGTKGPNRFGEDPLSPPQEVFA